MNVDYASTPTLATSRDLVLLQSSLEYALPADYTVFLTRFGSGSLALNEYVGSTEVARDIAIHKFFTVTELVDPHAWWIGRVPEGFLPIADSAGGNLICLALHDEDRGAVYFWDHSWEAEEDEIPDMRNMTLVATSFTDFLVNLQPVTTNELGPTGTGWIDADFARELGLSQ